MKRILTNERGIALAVAIFALVVVGALVAGAFFAGMQEQRVGENTRRGVKAFGVAEAGTYEVIRTWQPESINQRPVYPNWSMSVPVTGTAYRTGSYMGAVYKLNANLYMVDVTGADRYTESGSAEGGARTRLGMLVRVRPLKIQSRASLTTQGGVLLGGNAMVDGGMHTPTTWTNCEAVPDTGKPGVRTPDANRVTGGPGHTAGDPPILQDPAVADSTFMKFGDLLWSDLVQQADIQFVGDQNIQQIWPAVSGNGACDKTVVTNWGDGARNPPTPCATWFPIVYVNGSLTINTGQGQGILLVQGDLYIQGGFEYFGVVIVQGGLFAAGGAGGDPHFWGAVMARNADLDPERITGNATLNYSKCAILQALQNTGIVSPLRSRSWAQLF